ncbi:peptidoglycan editing factor PgeF [Hominifimenecus sp. rT4P-3]|uniref:peptidoglycan editing factor PgeF n=1 Tax=Hominifimenecus sp. rT4P-3 TaxID=3242979 RepID=UPI003DA55560
MIEQEKEGVTYLTFPMLERTGLVTHAFSTRKGGVSKGIFATMNFAVGRGDDPACVQENYRRMAKALGVAPEQMVLSQQTHTTNLRIVTKADAGKGVVRERDYTDIDGLLTDEPGIMLVTSYADCVPLYFLDPVKKVIALSHSGWRGTVSRMGAVTVEAMQRSFGSNPEQILACIGPSICQDCYEVSEDVAEAFRAAFPEKDWPEILKSKPESKYQLDLWAANQKILLSAGIREDHLVSSGICTCCHSDFLFSHRATQGKRGNLGAFLMLNP